MNNTKEWQNLSITIKNAHPELTTTRIAEMVDVPRTTLRDYFSRYYSAMAVDRVDEMYPQILFPVKTFDPYEETKVHDNSRILFISDLHFPFHHRNTFEFLQMLKDRYKPTRIIGLGDELDHHAMSFHDSDPDLFSAGDELKESLKYIKQLEKMFPEMTLLDSNHGSMMFRKSKHHGIPRHYLKSYNEVLGVSNKWKWVNDLVLDLPDGQQVYCHHGKSPDAVKTSQAMSMSHVCGHHHERFGIQYWANPNGLFFAINSGCLIDDSSYAFAYNNTNLKRPLIGTSLIIDGVPVLEAMPL